MKQLPTARIAIPHEGDTASADRRAPRRRAPALAVRWLAALASAALAATCGDSTGPDPDAVSIRLDVSGGFAGVSYSIEVDGQAGVVRGVACNAGCDFDPGQVIVPLSAETVRNLAEALEDGGVYRYDGTNFGTQCCDQFEYTLTYGLHRIRASFSGSAGALPESLAPVVARIQALSRGTVPAIVDFSSSPDARARAPLVIDSLRLDGPILTLHVTWTGGCAEHPIDLLFRTGFTGDDPVRADAVLAHDARGDTCEAIVSSARRFDLSPLRDAWHRAFGSGAGSILVRISAPGSNSPVDVDFQF